MREFAVWLGLLLFTAVLLYGGLNLTESGIAGVAAPAPGEGAFRVRHDPGAGLGITVVFAGWTARLYLDEIEDLFDR